MADEVKPGYLTSEFWATIAASATAFTALFVALGKITPTEQQSLNANITAGIVAVGAALAAVWSVVQYIKARTLVKTTE